MNTRDKIFYENRIQANRFAATMLIIISVAAGLAIALYFVGFRSEIVNTNYGSYLMGFALVGFSAWLGTAGVIIAHKGEGDRLHFVIVADLLMAGIISSFLLRINVNWPMFVLCVIYTIRYSDPKFTVHAGVTTTLGIIFTHYMLIPYGIATGYMNLNFIEMASDETLFVKKGSFGIYNAIRENGHIEMSYVYREAAIEILFPLAVYIAFVYICYHIARYNRRRIIEQAFFEDRINAALEDANQANEAKTLFLNRMSHDIRTPMNAVVGYTELLSLTDDPEQSEKYINNIKISSRQLMNLINNVLEMSRIESGRLVLSEEATDVIQFIDEINVMLEATYNEKNIQVVRNVDIKSRYNYLDKSKCNEIFLNIISNSIKYTPVGGRIEITVNDRELDDSENVMFFVQIKDNGKGMSKEFLPHIFENFAREDDANSNAVMGTGLGMCIVKQLVDLMNGTIEVDSELDKGTCVTINIPLRKAREEDVISSENTSVDEVVLSGKRILLAEDNDLNAEIMIDILGIEDAKVERARDGLMCIEMLTVEEAGYYDMILMDFQMPRMDGLEATRKIREMDDDAKSSIPIIAMTANAFESDRQKAMDAGMDGFVSKPIDLDVLKQILAKTINRK